LPSACTGPACMNISLGAAVSAREGRPLIFTAPPDEADGATFFLNSEHQHGS